MEIKISVKTCKQCPHFTTANQWSSDGWDRMEDWVCTKSQPHRVISRSVEWHEESKIEIPEWCEIKVDVEDNLKSGKYIDWIGKEIFKKSGKPFKNGEKTEIVVGIRINEYSKKLAFIVSDEVVVDCHQCELTVNE